MVRLANGFFICWLLLCACELRAPLFAFMTDYQSPFRALEDGSERDAPATDEELAARGLRRMNERDRKWLESAIESMTVRGTRSTMFDGVLASATWRMPCRRTFVSM